MNSISRREQKIGKQKEIPLVNIAGVPLPFRIGPSLRCNDAS